jgi:hypothetical protein
MPRPLVLAVTFLSTIFHLIAQNPTRIDVGQEHEWKQAQQYLELELGVIGATSYCTDFFDGGESIIRIPCKGDWSFKTDGPTPVANEFWHPNVKTMPLKLTIEDLQKVQDIADVAALVQLLQFRVEKLERTVKELH